MCLRIHRAMGLFAVFGISGIASAASLSVVTDAGTTNTTTALTGFSTTGAQMDGMSVRAFFSDGSQSVGTWADTGASSGAASVASRFSLSESGDTFGGTWSLSNLAAGLSITRVVIDAGVGDSVFDLTSPATGTPGSANGWTFQLVSANVWDIVATYRNQVALGAAAPVGDLWRHLDIAFNNANGLASGQTVQYIADTDNLQFAGDIAPVVPLPMAVWGGLVLLGGIGATHKLRAGKPEL
jgi:hypothetical protein